jgi:hypothetical protein
MGLRLDHRRGLDKRLVRAISGVAACPVTSSLLKSYGASRSQVMFGLPLPLFLVQEELLWHSEFDLRLILVEIPAKTRLLDLVTLPRIHASTKLQRSPRFDLAFLRLSFALLRGVANA